MNERVNVHLFVYKVIRKRGKSLSLEEIRMETGLPTKKIKEILENLVDTGFLLSENDKYRDFLDDQTLNDYFLIKNSPCFICDKINDCEASGEPRNINCTLFREWVSSEAEH